MQFTKECGIAKIPYPVLWDVDNPVIYTAVVKVIDENGNVVDNQNVRFGIRSSKFTSEGYFLNGRRLKINGVCMHHDLGSLGAAVSVPAMRRQIEILKEIGDVLWYASALCTVLDLDLETVATLNMRKLEHRFGGVFSDEKSKARHEQEAKFKDTEEYKELIKNLKRKGE